MKFATRATAISPFLAMAYGEKATELEQQGHNVIRLNLGEPDFGAPDAVLDALSTSLDKPDYPYTSALGLPQLRQAISNFYLEKHQCTVDPDTIVVTAGASGALLLASAALVEEGDNILLGDPSYPCNRRFLNTFGGDVTLVPTRAEDNFQLTLKDVQSYWKSNTKGVLIATPANPTGTAIKSDELAAIARYCQQHDGFLIVDEIYLNLALEQPGSVTNASPTEGLQTMLKHTDFRDTVIVVNSFSKYFGMTGWRLGWCVVPPAMLPIMERLAQNLFICPSTLSQKAALACFTPQALAQCEANRATLNARARLVFSAIENMGLAIDAIPEGAFYAYINIEKTGLKATAFCDQLLADFHVALTPGNDFGNHRADSYVRLSFATKECQLTEGLRRISAFVSHLETVS